MDDPTLSGRAPEPPSEPDNLVADDLGTEAADARPTADRPHGGIRDTGHADFFDIDHRYLADPSDPLGQPERRQVVDDYTSQVYGAGSRTQASVGGTDPGAGTRPADTGPADTDPRAGRPDAEPGST